MRFEELLFASPKPIGRLRVLSTIVIAKHASQSAVLAPAVAGSSRVSRESVLRFDGNIKIALSYYFRSPFCATGFTVSTKKDRMAYWITRPQVAYPPFVGAEGGTVEPC